MYSFFPRLYSFPYTTILFSLAGKSNSINIPYSVARWNRIRKRPLSLETIPL